MIHSCSYYCDRPECIKAQRDELRERLARPEQEPVAWEDVLGAIARGWTHDDNKHKTMDVQLAVAIAKEIQDMVAAPPQRKPMTDDLYNELLFAVGNKYPNETRHQTALRYILQAEKGDEKAAHSIKGEA